LFWPGCLTTTDIFAPSSEELVDETITAPEKIEIPRVPKRKAAPEETNGNVSKHALEDAEESGVTKKRKLNTFIVDRPSKKQATLPEADSDIIVLDEDGAIHID
jgi:hypothetical protein